MSTRHVDVVVVGASLAGCTTAILLARAGAKVALVERHARPEAFKQLCTHFIQASALPVLQRLGIDKLIEEAGGIRNSAEIHTPFGWIGHHLGQGADGSPLHGYSIRRERLDPMLRALAEQTPGVTLMTGLAAKSLIQRDGRIVGIEARGPAGAVSLQARVVVAADGRHSEMARVAGIETRTAPNRRHGVAVPMRGVGLSRGLTSQMWMTGSEVAYTFPNEDGVTVLAWLAPPEVMARPRPALLDALKARIRSLPDAPDLSHAVQAAELFAVKDFPGQWRPPVFKGMALVGDAATSLDYLQGVGCGWAFESAAWLADAVAPALMTETKGDIDKGLQAYARRHRASLATHRFFINDFAARLGFNAIERLLYAAAARDVADAGRLARVGARLDPPTALLTPTMLAKAIWIRLRHRHAPPNGTRGEVAVPMDPERIAA